jgi:aspartate-semialdehyde dehydrogenase
VRVGIVGVGPVGDRIVTVLRERRFPVDGELIVMANRARTEVLDGRELPVKKAARKLFQGLDVVFFAGKEGAKGASVQWGPVAVKMGAKVVDNGGDFRMDPRYPLVVPEVNMEAVAEKTPHITSPNCPPSRWSWPSRRCTARRGSSGSSCPPTRRCRAGAARR